LAYAIAIDNNCGVGINQYKKTPVKLGAKYRFYADPAATVRQHGERETN